MKPVTKYALLLEALVLIQKAGEDIDGGIGDQIRDAMDRPWIDMSQEDRNFVRNMSAYFYDLEELSDNKEKGV